MLGTTPVKVVSGCREVIVLSTERLKAKVLFDDGDGGTYLSTSV